MNVAVDALSNRPTVHAATVPINVKYFRRAAAKISGVTMGWLLRLVTGAPLVVGGPRQFYFILNQRGGAPT